MHQTKTTRSIQTTYNIWIRAATAYSLDLKKTYIQHTHIYYHHCCKHSARFFDLFRNNIINPFEGSTRSFRSLLRSLRQDDCEISHWRSLQCIYSQIVFFSSSVGWTFVVNQKQPTHTPLHIWIRIVCVSPAAHQNTAQRN